MKNDNLIKLWNSGSLIHKTADSDLDRPIEDIDSDETYTLREILQLMLDIYKDEAK